MSSKVIFISFVDITHNVSWLHDVAKSKRKDSIKQPINQVQKQH
jgi:hypothetical protein